MNARQEAVNTMFGTVETVCEDHAEIIANIPAFQAAFDEFKAKIAEIRQTEQVKDTPLTGIAADKTALKQYLAQTAADIAGLIYAYASATQNYKLKAEVNVSVSKLIQTRDTELAPHCQIIHDRGQTNLTALADYGVTAEKLANLQTAADNYQAAAPQTRKALSRRTVYTDKMRRLLSEANVILKDRMDKTVVSFAVEHPDLVAIYRNARKITDPAKTATQLKGKITNRSDGQPVKGASVTIVELNITAKTDAAGDYLIKPVKPGKYTVRATAVGFQDLELDGIDFKAGIVKALNIAL